MFESITFFHQKNRNTPSPFDIGAMVECMLFYGKTNVVVNHSTLKQLLIHFGIDRVIEILEEDLLSITYTETATGIFTNTINGVGYHNARWFSIRNRSYQNEIRKICVDIVGKSGKGRRTARRIQDLITVKNHENIILEGGKKSILDQDYVNLSANSVLQTLVPEAIGTDSVQFRTEETEKGIVVATNINFSALNKVFHKYVPPSQSTITPALILSHILDVESELYFASNSLSELATSEMSAKLMSHKINYLLGKSLESAKKITDFQNFVFEDAKSLREAVNDKKIDLDELIEVLKRSQKFKKWISGIDPDKDLLKNYYAEVTKDSIVDKIPGKSVRWGIFTGAGLIADAVATGGLGTAIGLGVGALDTFYIDKLIKGWKPNQFIEVEVKRLLDTQ